MRRGGDNSATESIHQALKWLDKCRNTHKADCGPGDPSFRPSRLLQLRKPESNTQDTLQVKLVESKHFNKTAPVAYACLSHCWGGIKPKCITTKETISANMERISWSTIPLTFQHAMVVATGLGIQYIWIDSLCIIQGDDDDWRREAAMMASVYSNALITIAATSSANCHQGLYRTDLPQYQLSELPVSIPGHPSLRFLAQAVSHNVIWQQYRLSPDLMSSTCKPLLSRAWFFQEWRLSPRLLHFVQGEVVWQCRQGSICQCQSFEGYPPFPALPYKQVEYPSSPTSLQAEVWGKPHQDWFRTVEAYSGLALSYRTDKLAAISGVAKTTPQFRMGNTYAAGIWRECMPWGLCWYTDPQRQDGLSQRLPATPAEWVAPSWSWASIDARVTWPRIGNDRECLVVSKCNIDDVTCEPKGGPEDATGPLKDASITITGLATQCILKYDASSRPKYSISIGEWMAWQDLKYFHPDFVLVEENHSAPGLELECLFLCSYEIFGKKDEWAGCCLILTPSRRKEGAFERVGLLPDVCSNWGPWGPGRRMGKDAAYHRDKLAIFEAKCVKKTFVIV